MILILPDDSHAYIPVTWTNLQTKHHELKKSDQSPPTIGSCRELMQVHIVVDSLLRRIDSDKTATQAHKENDTNETNDPVGTKPESPLICQSDLGPPRFSYQKGGDRQAVITDGQVNKSRTHGRGKRTGGQS